MFSGTFSAQRELDFKSKKRSFINGLCLFLKNDFLGLVKLTLVNLNLVKLT